MFELVTKMFDSNFLPQVKLDVVYLLVHFLFLFFNNLTPFVNTSSIV